jgi:hypothetical protein
MLIDFKTRLERTNQQRMLAAQHANVSQEGESLVQSFKCLWDTVEPHLP